MMNGKSGIIIIDKPKDITSSKVVCLVKKALQAKKVGHTGTLDPFATGVLICCINEATKIAKFFLTGDKKYEAVLHIGIETDTQDFTGKILNKCEIGNLSISDIELAFKKYEGDIYQNPPLYSALKHNGVPLYKLARKGEFIKKEARKISIFSNDILEINLPYIKFKVHCSSGTYIRTLCSDIGTILSYGGHLKELRRIESSGFNIDNAVPLDEFYRLLSNGELDKKIINSSDALKNMVEEVVKNKFLLDKIKYGRIITESDLELKTFLNKDDYYVKLIDEKNHLLSIIKYEKEAKKYNYCCNFN